MNMTLQHNLELNVTHLDAINYFFCQMCEGRWLRAHWSQRPVDIFRWPVTTISKCPAVKQLDILAHRGIAILQYCSLSAVHATPWTTVHFEMFSVTNKNLIWRMNGFLKHYRQRTPCSCSATITYTALYIEEVLVLWNINS